METADARAAATAEANAAAAVEAAADAAAAAATRAEEVEPGGCCSPRHVVQSNSMRGFDVRWMTW